MSPNSLVHYLLYPYPTQPHPKKYKIRRKVHPTYASPVNIYTSIFSNFFIQLFSPNLSSEKKMADVAAVTFLLEQVTGVIKGYADLISGADKEFKNLKKDVEELKAILKDTANKSRDDNASRLIKSEIREVVYDVEDAIDSWLTESKGKSKAGRLIKKYNFADHVKKLRDDKLKSLLENAKKMKSDLASLGTSKEEEAQERRMVKYSFSPDSFPS